ncbi:bZIP transcription factor 2-like [Lycium barbarum]|uniref:bZIP transcription factor 2-like n=1 Tax=Lycium barbarum TaxID=112863 RepID=UPI00293F1F25|nr:bZIP transcription factor 2-like [Lycium barbarum]
MMSTFPATTLSTDGLLSNLFSTFDGGFTPWDSIEPAFLFPQEVEDQEPVFSPKESPPSEPVISNSDSGSDDSKPNSIHSSSGSDEPGGNNNNNNNSNRCPDKRKRKPTTSNRDIDERKRRRMVSNRESARRSRMRKQKHLENLRNLANGLKLANRELMNRLRLITHQCQLVQCDNERLRTESAMLRERLEAIRQILILRQLEQFNSYSAWARNNMELQRPQ